MENLTSCKIKEFLLRKSEKGNEKIKLRPRRPEYLSFCCLPTDIVAPLLLDAFLTWEFLHSLEIQCTERAECSKPGKNNSKCAAPFEFFISHTQCLHLAWPVSRAPFWTYLYCKYFPCVSEVYLSLGISMHLARLAHKGTILGYREWAVLEGRRTWSGDQKVPFGPTQKKMAKGPQICRLFGWNGNGRAKRYYCVFELYVVKDRSKGGEDKIFSFLMWKNQMCVCVGGSLGLIAFSFGGHTCCLWMFLG